MNLSEYHGILQNDLKEPISRILFLDIDGVMVTDFSAGNMDSEGDNLFDQDAVKALNKIIDQTDCHIVISSSWRKRDINWLRQIFSVRGLNNPLKIIGETMRGYHFVERGAHLPIPRGVEIKAWIDCFVRHVPGKGFINDDYQYAILDDDSDMLLEQKDYFVKTDSSKGLTEIEAGKVIYIFNN